jgi:TPR repeat protein
VIGMDRALAAHCYRPAADQGSPVGQFNDGILLATGDWITMDTRLVGHYSKLTADEGSGESDAKYRPPSKSSEIDEMCVGRLDG